MGKAGLFSQYIGVADIVPALGAFKIFTVTNEGVGAGHPATLPTRYCNK